MNESTSRVKQDTLLAWAVLAAFRGRTEAEVEEMSRNLYTLRSSGVDTGRIDLRRVPGGFYSEDLEILIGHYLDSDFAEQRNPVRLKPEGFKLLREIIEEERKKNPNGVKQLADVLGEVA